MIFKDFWLQRPITIIMIFIAIIFLGIISFFKLPISLMPEEKNPWVSIIVNYPGISPQKIETLITKPIEEEISLISGITKIQSVSEEGKSRINVQFSLNQDINFAIINLRAKIDMVKVNFPREVQEPIVIKYDPSQSPVFILALSSKKKSLKDLRDLAENKLKTAFQRVDGVSEIFISGGAQKEIHVDIDWFKLLKYNIDIQQVFRQVQFANVFLSSGVLQNHGKITPILTPWKFTSLEQIQNTSVHITKDQKEVKVKNIATTKFANREKDSLSRINSQERVGIYIQKSGIANTVSLSASLSSLVLQLKKKYKDINFEIIYDQATFIKNALKQVIIAVLLGSIIAILVLMFFLKSFRDTFIVGLSLPVAIIATFIFFYIKKLSLNVFTLSGLALAAGMLVDNSIVVIESIFAKKNISLAVRSVEKAILAATLTTIVVFLPIVFTNQKTRMLYGDITLVIIFAILFSMLTSLILLPVLSSLLQKKQSHSSIQIFLQKNRFVSFAASKFLLLKKIPSLYKKILEKTLKHFKFIMAGVILFIIVAFLLAPNLPQEYIDPLDTGNLKIFVELPTGYTLEETDKVTKKVEQTLNTNFNCIKKMSTRIEKSHTSIVIELKKKRKLSTKAFIKKAQKLTRRIKGADIIFSESSASGSGQREIEINLIGEEPNQLRYIAKDLAKDFNQIPYVQEIIFHFKEPQEQISVVVDKEKAALHHLNSHLIANYLRNLIYGPVTTKFFEGDHEVDIRIMLDKKFVKNIEDLKRLYIRNTQGQLIPLTTICHISKIRAPSKIYRLNKHRSVSLSVKYDNTDLNRIIKMLNYRLMHYPFPANYSFEFGTNYEVFTKNRREMIWAVIFAIILVYFVLASIFENLSLPLIILFSIPLTIASVFFTFFIFRLSLNISVYIGLIMLGGIVVNNGIILLDSIRQLRRTKTNLKQVIIEASTSRLRPIFMTTLTTIFGLLPILFNTGDGSNLWKPLAVTVIVGLSFSTILVLFIIPALYYYINKSSH